ncbi:ARAP2 protein, partial [Polypterus senegalus]
MVCHVLTDSCNKCLFICPQSPHSRPSQFPVQTRVAIEPCTATPLDDIQGAMRDETAHSGNPGNTNTTLSNLQGLVTDVSLAETSLNIVRAYTETTDKVPRECHNLSLIIRSLKGVTSDTIGGVKGVSTYRDLATAWAVFTFEIYLQSERVFLFGAETVQSQHDWVWAISKYFIPPSFQTLAQRDYELIGRLFIKEGHNLYYWKVAWFALEESCLYFYSGEDSETEAKIYLKRLQELTISTQADGAGKIDVLLLVEKGRTLYIHGHNKLDFTVWCSTIRKASGTNGKILRDQQLSKNDIPVIVDSCIAFVTQYGLSYEGIYQTSGNPASVSQLLDQFRKDARNVKLRYGEHVLQDVTDVLKCFLSEIDDALLTKELYPYWISILDNVRIEFFPPNCMALLQALDLGIIRTLKVYYRKEILRKILVSITCRQEEIKINVKEAIEMIANTWTQISPTMKAEELTDYVLEMKSIVSDKSDVWITFEAIENGELERPLHYSEKVLEQVLTWSSLEEPGCAYLVIKNFNDAKRYKSQQGNTKGFIKGGYVKIREMPCKLMYGNKFHDRYIILRDEKLLIYKDIKVQVAMPAKVVHNPYREVSPGKTLYETHSISAISIFLGTAFEVTC